MSNKTRMIQVPGPGEMRGEGTWVNFDMYCHRSQLTAQEAQDYWEELQITKYMPTSEE